MTKRAEFSAKVKDAAYARTKGLCAKCGIALQSGKIEYDHLLPCALGGGNELANCVPLCTACHSAKTGKEDVPRIRKADRQRKAHIGAKSEGPKIQSAGFQPVEKLSKISRAKIEKTYGLRWSPLTGERIQ
jgi:5-methylcytosine-specific restriction enzyme A